MNMKVVGEQKCCMGWLERKRPHITHDTIYGPSLIFSVCLCFFPYINDVMLEVTQ